MKIIIIVSTKWQWLTRLRLSQADLYYFMVSHCGDHAYQASRDFKKIKGVYRLADYAKALDPKCKTVQLYGKHYDRSGNWKRNFQGNPVPDVTELEL